MAEIKVVGLPEEFKRFLKSEASLRDITLSEIVIEALDKAHPKREQAAKRRTPKEKA
jgi:hypothetical protein